MDKKIIASIMIILAIISNIFAQYKYNKKYCSDNESRSYKVKIIEKTKQDEDNIKYLVKYNGDRFILNIYKSKYGDKVDLTKYGEYKYGDVINVVGKINIPELLGNPYEFNYKEYLNTKDICGLINTYKNIEYINREKDVISFLYNIKDYIESEINNSQSEKNAKLTKSYVYGDKSELDEVVKEEYANLGLSHMLVASGANISILILLLKRISKKLKFNNLVSKLFVIIQIIFFMALCNFEYSILRAGITGIITILIGNNAKISQCKKVLIAMYCIYILNPMCMYSVSMTLSFLATFSIMFFYPKLSVRLMWILKQKVKEKTYNVIKYPAKIFCISIAVQIGILPLVINTFNSISLFGIVINIFVGMLIGIVRTIGIIAILLWIIPGITSAIFGILDPIISLINILICNLQRISLSINIASLPSYVIVVYYLLIVCIIFKDRVVIKNFKQSLMTNKMLNKVKQCLIYLLIICIIIYKINSTFMNNYALFFNVKQGDMAIIKQMQNVVLIDAGSKSEGLAKNVLLNYCKKENIQRIDVLVISHFHVDHINGIQAIAEKIKISKIIYSPPKEKQVEYIEFEKWVKSKGIDVLVVNRGDKIDVGELQLCILSPGNEKIQSEDIANSNSLVCLLKVKEYKILFMGDATKETELQILKKGGINSYIDVLKVGHHGSKTSTDERFIKKVLPNIAIMSCQKKIYGHPSISTLDVLTKYNVLQYITEENGAIKIKY